MINVVLTYFFFMDYYVYHLLRTSITSYFIHARTPASILLEVPTPGRGKCACTDTRSRLRYLDTTLWAACFRELLDHGRNTSVEAFSLQLLRAALADLFIEMLVGLVKVVIFKVGFYHIMFQNSPFICFFKKNCYSKGS